MRHGVAVTRTIGYYSRGGDGSPDRWNATGADPQYGSAPVNGVVHHPASAGEGLALEGPLPPTTRTLVAGPCREPEGSEVLT